MTDTASRLLQLLSLLQSRPGWTGPELAERLGVSTRTVRTDVERLRALDYPVEAVRGPAGHYRLGSGAKLPPLLLDDEEAVAVAIGLRAVTGVAGVGESGARALDKLEQVLPARLRPRVAALGSAVTRGPENTASNVEDPEVDADWLAAMATAVHRSQRLRFVYRAEPVVVEPYRLVNWERRWYLAARGADSGEWGVYRVDWMAPRTPTGQRFTPRPLAGGGYAALVLRTVASAGWAFHARITVLAPAEEVLSRINAAVGVVEAVDADSCVLVTGADSVETVAVYVGMLGLDFRVCEPPELVAALRRLGERYAAAVPPAGA